jgi:hypothetical protein
MVRVTAVARSLTLALAALSAAACLGETTLLTPPKPPVMSFTFQFHVDPGDSTAAAALGWTDSVPDVALTVTPDDSTQPIRHFQGSDAGTFTLDQLEPGDYEVDAVRWLTDTEQALLPAGDDALGFVGRVALNPARAASELPVEMWASRRGSILFTEWAMLPAEDMTIGGYLDGGYVVIANNSDSTIYLDGMLMGQATSQPFEIAGAPCADRIAFYSDPAGLWTSWIYRFPGTGQDYPIYPGEHKLIATDAIDHRTIVPYGYDLSHADFEFFSYADVDNPSVPNLVSVGLNEPVSGHGLVTFGGSSVFYIALPTDVASLPQGVLPYTSSTFVRIPADRVLDVVTDLVSYDYAYPLCGTYVNPRFDRQTPEVLNSFTYTYSLQRRRTGLDGTGPYQWTRSTAADFVVSPKTAPR